MNSILKVSVTSSVVGTIDLNEFSFISGYANFYFIFSVQQLLVFSARTITERTALGARQSVEADQNVNGKIVHYGFRLFF